MSDDKTSQTGSLEQLVLDSEDWLMGRILEYAQARGYTKYTSTLKEAWRLSISGLSKSLLKAIDLGLDKLELLPEEDYGADPVASFGVLEAKLHRERGVELGMFLSLMKYYRQTYLDLIYAAGFEPDYLQQCRLIVIRFFDRVELGFCKEWASHGESEKTRELQGKNRDMTNEKNKYLTIFESLQEPAILLDTDNRVVNVNHAWIELFEGAAVPGSVYYGKEPVERNLPWLADGLRTATNETAKEQVLEKTVETVRGPRDFFVKIKRMQDVSNKFVGAVILLTDITELKHLQATLQERERLQGVLEMAGAVCHEMNQPLMAIAGFVDLCKIDLDPESPVYEKLVKIEKQEERLGEFTRRLMQIARYETKKYMDIDIIDLERSSASKP
jgi:signal transduction histidine kinase